MTSAQVSSPLGLARRTVRRVDHDLRWPTLSAEERDRLQQNLGHELPIELVGSTAVPGLVAKPVLDLTRGVQSEPAHVTLAASLQRAGYVHGDSDVIPGRLYFRRDDANGLRTHQASVCVAGGRFWVTHIAFRDALRTDSAVAEASVRLKQELGVRFPTDRLAYPEAKSEFVAGVLRAMGIE